MEFPNRDAIFHNVFSVTPITRFDLGSYRQGETKGVVMSKPGVVKPSTATCTRRWSAHPRRADSNYVARRNDGFLPPHRRAGGDASHRRVVPNSNAGDRDRERHEGEVVTVGRGQEGQGPPAPTQDALPYGSYENTASAVAITESSIFRRKK